MPYPAPQEHLPAEEVLFKYFFTTEIFFVVNWQKRPLVSSLMQAPTPISSSITLFILVATF
jgi:hypothetical protein